MRLRIQVTNEASSALRRLSSTRVPEARQRMVDQAIHTALESTLEMNPVRTGRSRAAWAAALAQLGGGGSGSPSNGPQAEGAALGSAVIEQTDTHTTATATNAVRYVPFLEYGTSKRAPVAMVRRSLAAVQRVISSWFRLS